MHATVDARDAAVVLDVVVEATASSVGVMLFGLLSSSKDLRPVVFVVEVIVAVGARTHSRLGILELLLFFEDVGSRLLCVTLHPLKMMLYWLHIRAVLGLSL